MRKTMITCDICKEEKPCTPFLKIEKQADETDLRIHITTERKEVEPNPPTAHTTDICFPCLIGKLQTIAALEGAF